MRVALIFFKSDSHLCDVQFISLMQSEARQAAKREGVEVDAAKALREQLDQSLQRLGNAESDAAERIRYPALGLRATAMFLKTKQIFYSQPHAIENGLYVLKGKIMYSMIATPKRGLRGIQPCPDR